MRRRLALVSTLAVLSAVAFAPKAGAQAVPATQNVDFTANLAGTCTFTGTTAGTLAVNGPFRNWLEASSARGTRGQTTVNCTSGGQLAVSLPVLVTGPAGYTPSAL